MRLLGLLDSYIISLNLHLHDDIVKDPDGRSRTNNIFGDESLKSILAGDGTFTSDGENEFYINFCISVFSATLGLSKSLKNGVARCLGDEGYLDGLLSLRHLLAFFACGASLLIRGACLGIGTEPRGVRSRAYD